MFRFHSFVLTIFAVLIGLAASQPDCSAPPPKTSLFQCCVTNEKVAQVETKCFDKFPPKDPKRMFDFCFGECIFNETGMTENGKFEMDKAKAKIGDFFKDTPDAIPVAEQALTKCDKKIKDMQANKPAGAPPMPIRTECTPHVTMLAGCMIVETFLNCPASRWQNNAACNSAKEYMKACAFQPPPKPPQ